MAVELDAALARVKELESDLAQICRRSYLEASSSTVLAQRCDAAESQAVALRGVLQEIVDGETGSQAFDWEEFARALQRRARHALEAAPVAERRLEQVWRIWELHDEALSFGDRIRELDPKCEEELTITLDAMGHCLAGLLGSPWENKRPVCDQQCLPHTCPEREPE